MAPPSPQPGSARYRLPVTVVALGVVSLLTDLSSEMIFPLLPAFLAARVANAPVLIGAMEGLADLVASVFKYLSGRWADRAVKLKPLVTLGYAIAGAARPLMAFITTWWQPLLIRSVDRVGKGIRGTPRDAMIAHAVPRESRATAFGFHRGMDHTGAALGSAAAALLVWLGLTADRIFLVAAIPGAIGVAAIALTREPERPPLPSKQTTLAPVPRRVWFFLVPVALFGLANATDAFLLLRLTDQGASAATLPIAWLVLHIVKAAVSYPAGRVADRLGPQRVVLAGWILYAIAYAAVGFSNSWQLTFVLIAAYGLYHAFAEGAEKAVLSVIVPQEAQGRAFGLYNGLAGVSALIAGLLFGAVWQGVGAKAAFLMGAGIAALASVAFGFLLPRALEVR